ncbi:AhpC/TSA antioxidant enzyme-domain-containing protein, partial [Schizophyllum amplum]
LAEAADLEIFDAQGQPVKFGSLFADDKTVVVFIRHFLCGICQAYVTALAKAVTPEALKAANVRLAVVGCGDPRFIQAYAGTATSDPNRRVMYADPDRKVFHALGMDIETLQKTPAGQDKRSYLPASGAVAGAVNGIVQGLKQPALLGRQGNISQLGGEFVLGPGNVCTFASRMQHTEDHVEVAELLKQAGI